MFKINVEEVEKFMEMCEVEFLTSQVNKDTNNIVIPLGKSFKVDNLAVDIVTLRLYDMIRDYALKNDALNNVHVQTVRQCKNSDKYYLVLGEYLNRDFSFTIELSGDKVSFVDIQTPYLYGNTCTLPEYDNATYSVGEIIKKIKK